VALTEKWDGLVEEKLRKGIHKHGQPTVVMAAVTFNNKT
jgi:hypothetical protein